MLKLSKFSGINNVLPSERLVQEPRTLVTPLAQALNVDLGFSGEIHRRSGYTQASALSHKNVHQADGFLLATCGGDLTAIHPGGARTVIYPSLSDDRVWYTNLPDGRTTFSNGLICGITDGAARTDWGVPVPPSIGALTDVPGSLYAGDYQYQITYVRLTDGLEGGPAYSGLAPVTGGVVLTGLPQEDGYSINVYLTSHNGGEGFYAGSTSSGVFSYTGTNDALVMPCRTDQMYPAPAGRISAFWRGRVLTAVGPVLYASRTNQYELFDLRRDFKQFSSDITLVQPVDDGIYVGTATELAFLSGTEWDKLSFRTAVDGQVVLGSGVSADGELVKMGDGVGSGVAMICIVDRTLVAGFNGGTVVRLTEGRYATSVTEVMATFRRTANGPQYMAVPR